VKVGGMPNAGGRDHKGCGRRPATMARTATAGSGSWRRRASDGRAPTATSVPLLGAGLRGGGAPGREGHHRGCYGLEVIGP